jgi:hypothetical protein
MQKISISSIINKVISEDNNYSEDNNLKYIKKKWIELRKNNKFSKKLDWSKHIKKYDNKTARKLYNFRESLKKYIMTRCNICEKDMCSKCESVGSKKLTSDIDISINTSLEFSIAIKLIILILNDLKLIFNEDKFFHHNNKFELKRVHKFFDINFYITNFELKKKGKTDIQSFSSYFISDSYNKNIYSINQYYFAFYEFFLFESNNKKTRAYYKLLNIVKYSKGFNRYLYAIKELNDIIKTENNNKIINKISTISLYENDSYHSQGSYFHIVMMIQKGINFHIKNKRDKEIYKNLLSASVIENLCFSYINKAKKYKYLSRVKDGLDRLKISNINIKLFNSLEKNINNLNNRIYIKREILTILKKLHF